MWVLAIESASSAEATCFLNTNPSLQSLKMKFRKGLMMIASDGRGFGLPVNTTKQIFQKIWDLNIPVGRCDSAAAGQAPAIWLGADVEADGQTGAPYSTGHVSG